MSKYLCPHCRKIFTKEEHQEIKKKYPMTCPYCKKEFKAFDVI